MASRLIFLTGAPEASSLSWGDDVGLFNSFQEPITRFARLDNRSAEINTEEPSISSAPIVPYWRSVPLERRYLPTGISQDVGKEEYEGARFFATSYIGTFLDEFSQGEDQTSSLKSIDEVLSQFYEESYGVHQDIPSSEIDAVSQASASAFTQASSFHTSFDSRQSHNLESQNIPTAGNLSNLKDIPNANYLSSINPQTMTVNLIVGIISILEPRTIRTKRGAEVKLVEIIAGDETKSGFGINFWLSNPQQASASVLGTLRPQDIVLMRNVALSSFRGRVYGQSLRRNVTKVDLFYRKRIDRTDSRGYYGTVDLDSGARASPQIEKTKRVREWIEKFVGPGPSKGKRFADEVFREVMPPDSPPSQD